VEYGHILETFTLFHYTVLLHDTFSILFLPQIQIVLLFKFLNSLVVSAVC